MTRSVIYLPYFGSGRFAPLLLRLIKELEHIGTKFPVVALTDNETEVPSGVPAVRIGIGHQLGRYIRNGHEGEGFDRKAALVLGLLQLRLPHNIVVMDTDNFVRANFDHEIATICIPSGDARRPSRVLEVRDIDLAMPPAPGEPYATLIHHPQVPLPVSENTSAFMMFRGGDAGFDVGELFKHYWTTHNSLEADHKLKEERTWSLVWYHYAKQGRARLLPPEMSWSRFWGEEPADTLIRHKHGAEKWEGGK